MEVRMMFWLIAGLAFVSAIILVGVSMSGQLMQVQTCSEEDIYYATSDDDRGSYCGRIELNSITDLHKKAFEKVFEKTGYLGDIADKFVDEEPYVYCNYAEVTEGVRGTFVEKDPCVNKEEHLCCRTCYEASGVYSGPECGRIDVLHAYKCRSGDVCANEETGRCCRDWPELYIEE